MPGLAFQAFAGAANARPSLKRSLAVQGVAVAMLVGLCSAAGGAERAGALRTIAISAGPKAQQQLQTAFIEARPGDVIELAGGAYHFDATLSLDVDFVTLRGEGPDKTILSFAGLKQGTGGEGLLATGDHFTIEDLAVENAKGDAIKVSGADGVVFRRVRAEWTGGPKPTNGSYGLYPVLCRNVLVEDCVVRGSSDAGIYVGQSQQVVVRRNRTYENVAGIEIENCIAADVYENEATDNAGGVLVFTLPDLVQKIGRQCRVFNNRIHHNNHENFAPAGNIVAQVPSGTGVMIMASDEVEIFGNQIAENQTVNLAVISYQATKQSFSDAEFDPYPEAVSIHDNQFSGGGEKPAGELALLKVLLLRRELPDIICDWSEDPEKLVDGKLPDALKTVIADNGDAEFARIDLAAAVPAPNKITQDAQPYLGRRPPLAAVKLDAWPAPRAPKTRREPPEKLSGWGLFEGNGASQQPIEGVIPYDINTPLFSDYTQKYRFVRLPEGKPAAYSADRVFELPVGAVIAKTFAMPRDLRRPEARRRLLETRILEHAPEGWLGWAYVWNDEQTEASLAVAGDSIDVEWIHTDGKSRTNDYLVPNVNQCQGCHATSAGMQPIGLSARQLNRDFGYAHGVENQLAYWTRTGAVAGATEPSQAPRLAVWDDPQAELDARARAWLEINCAHCHQPGGAAQNSGLDLRASQREPVKIGLRKPPVAAGAGSGGLQFDILPGQPDRSILMFRLLSTHPDVMMPELGKRMVHDEGVQLVRQWIASMVEADAQKAAPRRR